MYLDSAIVVKLLVLEPESEWFMRNLSGQSFEISELALAEVCAALLIKERSGDLTPDERIKATETFFSMIEDELILLLPLNRNVVQRARAVQLACHPSVPLRTLDALHVATCDLHKSDRMSATDRRIRAACKQLGIALMPQEIEDIGVN
ncbi:MAG TPA: type II toxin-antitoxin system VapC family toxin [Verrucomicrobiae bacterium]|jgi:predicted nucleic acid-binding protein